MQHDITLTLPDSVYMTLCEWAKTQKKSVRQVATETLQTAIQSTKAEQQSEAVAYDTIVSKSDEELWHIAQSHLSPGQTRRWRRLIMKHEMGDTLTPHEERTLQALLEAGERLTALKAEAYALLQQRGHPIPALQRLHERQRSS